MDRKLLEKVWVMTLTNGGYKANLMKAERLVDNRIHNLPPGKAMMAIPIHCLPGSPDGWVRGPGSYVVEVDAEHGLWFDFTGNDKYNTAIVPTVKGMNPITGLKTEDVGIHQYREECPIHHVPFGHKYFCEECGYKWPAQNYVSHPNVLWWDGFRQTDGSVRQFFFTEEDKRDIASAIIGKKNTVPAFGFAFYRCKNDKSPKGMNLKRYSSPQAGSNFLKKSQERFNKDVSVGAGARISQSLEIDKTPLKEWGDSPESVITLYFVFSEQLEQIVEKGGIKKLESKPEGYLENVSVG